MLLVYLVLGFTGIAGAAIAGDEVAKLKPDQGKAIKKITLLRFELTPSKQLLGVHPRPPTPNSCR
jgi:hypothetical protein